MRKVVSWAAFAAVAFVPSVAAAQSAPGTQGNQFNLQREQLGAYGAGDAARARARKGDCAGALPLFDQAIAGLDDPTLRRDRGLCHEALRDPYPAIDDFRAYLYGAPDAPDADDIRARLERIEAQVGVGGPSPYRNQSESASMSASGSVDAKYDSARDEEADSSGPLRSGKGWTLAPILGVRAWFFASGTSQSDIAEDVGVRLTWVLDQTSAFLAELGYQRWDNSDAAAVALSGLTSQIAYEARIPFNRETNLDNLIILGIGVGYDHLIFNYGAQTVAVTVPSMGGVGPRARAGYRHNFSRRAAIEATLDGGGEAFFVYNGGSSPTGFTPWIGLNGALLFAL